MARKTADADEMQAAGTFRWMAPEVMKDDDVTYKVAHGPRRAGDRQWPGPTISPLNHAEPRRLPNAPQSDVYSYGVVLWELVTREVPFADLPLPQIIYSVVAFDLRPFLPATFPESLSQLCERCWAKYAKCPQGGGGLVLARAWVASPWRGVGCPPPFGGALPAPALPAH